MALLAGVVAAVLLPLSVLSVWVHGVVSDTDRYVETVAPLADDDAVQAAAVDELQRQALQLVGSSGTALQPAVERLARLAVRRVVDSPVFAQAWVEANRAAHRQLVAVLEDRSGRYLDDQGRVTLQLGPVLTEVAQDLAAQGLLDPARVPELDVSLAVLDGDRLEQAQWGYDLLDALGFWLPVLWLVAVALTLVAARRRLATTARLAVASLVTLGALALALHLARGRVTAGLPRREVAEAVWDVVVASLWRVVEVGTVVLAVVALVGAVLAAVTGRREAPSGPQPDGAAPS
jgi:hypothetical protein